MYTDVYADIWIGYRGYPKAFLLKQNLRKDTLVSLG